ncbi:hypothetical protein LAZ40_05415 [Cereibacter sphaeroides]|uniref:hypothetical protein n=1 Tax=Cereibacter sphaeroides TaxID=1063 RepID=UPI001F350830|nr:hypothetical protein [Cereibacter sphaeroides]MCE6958487.1 hypothetical protein [Cereibacter sphaeroides]MCE6972851.1 hypothetical protein [Cereibacter sphaeroides]
MSRLAQPFHLVYLNRDLTETACAVQSEREAVMKVAEAIGVGIDPLRGVTSGFWDRIDAASARHQWIGSSIFRITSTAADLAPIGKPLISPAVLNMTTLEAPLSNNPADPLTVILTNRGYSESACVLPDRRAAARKLVEIMDLQNGEIESAEDFEPAVQAAYQAGDWQGLTIVEIDPRTLAVAVLGPEELGFTIEDFGDTPEP